MNMNKTEKRPNRKLLNELGYEEVTIFENPDYDSAIIGVDSNDKVVYDYDKMVKHLMENDGMTYEEAVEFIDFNTIRAIPYFPDGPAVMYPLGDYQNPDVDLTYSFNAKKEKEEIVKWIRDWFEKNGKTCNAIIGLSGGKDSTIAAALVAEAIGKERVIGVALPDKGQGLNDADKIAEYLGIKFMNIPISSITGGFDGVWYNLGDEDFQWSKQSKQNIPPRIRMTMLYAISQSFNGRVVGTCNLSENYIGYVTRWGDQASDFEPLGNLTVTEVKAIGHELGLPDEWVERIPDDGLPHSSPDEQKFGFSYEVLDKYIRLGVCDDDEVRAKIDGMHNKNLFKLQSQPMYMPDVWE